MANGYIDYRGNSARVNDQILTIIVSLVADSVHRQPGLNSKIVSLVEGWRFEVFNSGPGLICIDLSGFWETSQGNDVLRSLLQRCEDELHSFGDTVPATKLAALNESTDIGFVDTSTELLLKELQKLKVLVEGVGSNSL